MSKKRKDESPEAGSLVDRYGFDNVMRGFLAVKPKGDEKGKKRTTALKRKHAEKG